MCLCQGKQKPQLVDRGANGGLAGSDMHLLLQTHRKVNVVVINDHELTGLNIVTGVDVLETNKRPAIGIFHEYAHLRNGNSIHASGQLEWFKTQVDDCSNVVDRIPTKHIKSEGFSFDLVPSSCSEKGVLKGSPKFYPNLTLPFQVPKSLE